MDRRTILIAGACLALGAAAALLMARPNEAAPPARAERPAVAAPVADRRTGFGASRGDDGRQRAALEQRIKVLEETVARESAERQRLEDELESMAAQLASRAGGAERAANAPAGPDHGAGAGAAEQAEAPPAAPPPAQIVDWSLSTMERALVSAGIDRARAGDIKRRSDELAMAEISLRDLATREGWVDTPRFEAELAEINGQRTSMRDEIGDEAYDRYLYAQGQTNRVRIDDVMTESPAAIAGLQPHDMILRYGDTRVFLPEDLVSETQGGIAGEMVRLEVIRNGERLHIDVPRGPLGVRIAPTQDSPTT